MRKLFLVFLTISISFCTPAQNYSSYMKEAGTNAVVFRGMVARVYPNYHYEGTYFAYDAQYKTGTLYYNGKFYEGLRLNLNAHRDELYVIGEAENTAVCLLPEMVKYFTLEEKKFVHLSDIATGDVKDGYYEILFEGTDDILYKKIVKKYDETVEKRIFYPVERYYLSKEGVFYSIKGRSSLLKLYPEVKRKLKWHNADTKGDELAINMAQIVAIKSNEKTMKESK